MEEVPEEVHRLEVQLTEKQIQEALGKVDAPPRGAASRSWPGQAGDGGHHSE
jgi:hypothetical protein